MKILIGAILGLGLFFLLLSQWGMNRGWRKNVTIKINHMTDTNRPGSMAAADAKTVKYFKIGMIIAAVIAIILLWTVPLLKAEAAQTGGFFKVLSWVAFIASFVIIAVQDKITNAAKSDTLFYVLWFISFGLGFFLRICGGI